MPNWNAISGLKAASLAALFAEDGERTQRFSIDDCGILFDFAKTHLSVEAVDAFGSLAGSAGLVANRDALFGGQIINVTEGRAAEHGAERGEGAPESVARAKALHSRMRSLIEVIDAGAMGEIAHVLHIGIGGSALGPDLLIDALARDAGRYDIAMVSNVDGAALAEVFKRFDPHKTLVALASKTFTTSETLLNAASALEWMAEAGVDDPIGKVIALTAAPQQAIEWGVDETRILPFNEAVGGRYSLWSSISFPAAMALGWAGFEELLEGAAAMDRHFRLTPIERNAPIIGAFVDLYYTQVRQCETRAVFAYDERLRLLPSYLQQLEMESNGKSVSAEGTPLGRHSAPVTWGGVGTDAQHAVFQLLHQGTHLIPVEFVAVIEPGHDLDEAHHRQLLGNCFAQGAALMAGRANDDLARNYPGDRPSTTILLDTLDPRTLGALIAFYEQRTFVNAVLLGINPFDQFGVELGKEMAKAIDGGGVTFDPSTAALIARGGGMMTYDYDLFIIGAGSGGVRAARISAGHGARVAVAEEYRVGGTCVIRGCVPKKLLVYGSHFAEDLADAKRFGWNTEGATFDWPTLRDNVAAEVDRLEGLYGDTFTNNKITLFHERATLAGPNLIRLASGQEISAGTILIATGAWPAIPAITGAELGITSNEVFHLPALPKRAVIAGAGYIANEFAGIFNELGVEVTLVTRGDKMLRSYDQEIVGKLVEMSLHKGIDIRFNFPFKSAAKQADGSILIDGGEQGMIETDLILWAIGRVPNTKGLGLEAAGVALGNDGAVIVGDDNRTNIASIYAVGDVTNRVQLTPVAIREGHAFADSVFGDNPRTIDYRCIPTAVFANPPIASVGMTEDEARAEFGDVSVYRSDFRAMKNVLAGRNERALYKMVTDTKTGRVLGLHMIGPDSAEILQAAAVAVKAGLTKADFDDTVALHPSMAEELVLLK